ncbi:MAG: galactokinase [Lentisphaerae bacterium RIFOXYC12_FULL_60_16]|nr:MAG: galactokinase [Lentisphaerae bacterium RIFOXYC12_FULL_60_16]
MSNDLYPDLATRFIKRFGTPHTIAAYAPGRVEVLGNHTDYNEGFVLSAAIDAGTWCLATPSPDLQCRIAAGDIEQEVAFPVTDIRADRKTPWANYVKGMLAPIVKQANPAHGVRILFQSTIPLGAGLSSSAALEIASGLALTTLYGIPRSKLELARMGQAAEHEYAGAKCGLLDQISSLFGKAHALVRTDFRSLEVTTVPAGDATCFLMCNTRVKHSLVDSEYNERRARCEEAAAFFAKILSHPVQALRDVSWTEFEAHRAAMHPVTARRAAHVIGENERVLKGQRLLKDHDLAGFGALMFESHESSRTQFENSCPELDAIVESARTIPGIRGARLSGGGFGGSAVILCHPQDASRIGQQLASQYEARFSKTPEIRVITPSDGARLLPG